eukprot:13151570-Ditylum_brightwellii.AAC.1
MALMMALLMEMVMMMAIMMAFWILWVMMMALLMVMRMVAEMLMVMRTRTLCRRCALPYSQSHRPLPLRYHRNKLNNYPHHNNSKYHHQRYP